MRSAEVPLGTGLGNIEVKEHSYFGSTISAC